MDALEVELVLVEGGFGVGAGFAVIVKHFRYAALVERAQVFD